MTELAFIGMAFVLVTYALSVAREDPLIFHVGNIVGGPMLVVSGIALGAYAHAGLSATFMAVAVLGLWKEHRGG